MDTFESMLIILFNFAMLLGFVASLAMMIDYSFILGLVTMIVIITLTIIFDYNEVIKRIAEE